MGEIQFDKELMFTRIIYMLIGLIWPIYTIIVGGYLPAGIGAMIVWDLIWFFTAPILLEIKGKKKHTNNHSHK